LLEKSSMLGTAHVLTHAAPRRSLLQWAKDALAGAVQIRTERGAVRTLNNDAFLALSPGVERGAVLVPAGSEVVVFERARFGGWVPARGPNGEVGFIWLAALEAAS
jgi:hypothetical protein